jgi:hypothetical protein
LRIVSGSTSLQALAPWQSSREHQTIVLYPMPDTVYTIGLPILRAIERSYFDGDPLPPHWENAVLDGMVHFWRVGSADAQEDQSGMWPSLKELIEYDNSERAVARRRAKPHLG